MDILIRGGNFSNKGAEAMLFTVQQQLAKRLPGVNFRLRVPGRDVERAYAAGFFPSVRAESRIREGLRLAGACVSNRHVRQAALVSRLSAQEVSDLEDVDAVLDISGFNYSDEWGVGCANRGLAWAQHCHAKGRHHICLPQAWGPFRMPAVAKATRRLCEYSSLIYARDKVSLSHLKELLGPDSGRLRMAPDIAFLFCGENLVAGRRTLESLGVDVENSPVVGITPNLRVYERCSGVGAGNEYVQMMIQIADHCVRTWDATVVLLPHELSVGQARKRDDRFLCGLIRAGASYPDKCSMLGTYISAPLLKSIESQLAFVIGSRFHSCVFALSSGVPVMALGWTHKYVELMELVGLDHDALTHKQFDPRTVMEVLDAAWKQRAESRAKIQQRLPEIRENVTSLFDNVANVLLQHQRSGC